MVGINVPYVKAQTRRIIEAAPTFIHPKRQAWVSDNYGGRKKVGDPYLVGEGFYALFDNTSSPNIQVLVSEGGSYEAEASLKLYVVHEEGLDIQREDVWEHNKRYYRFSNVTNVLELNILIEIDLEEMESLDYE